LLTENKTIRTNTQILSSKRPQFSYSEKQLRDAAASEVAAIAPAPALTEEGEKGSRKRKVLNPDEKAKKKRGCKEPHQPDVFEYQHRPLPYPRQMQQAQVHSYPGHAQLLKYRPL
jgi:hypothetical protein